MKNRFLLGGVLVLMTNIALGQHTVNAAGGGADIAGNNHEFSIGEMTVVSTNTTSSIHITHGVLQPVSSPTKVDDFDFINDMLSLYPNPTEDKVYLSFSSKAQGRLSYTLYDALGKLLQSKSNIELSPNAKQEIALSNYASGSYMLYVEYHNASLTKKQTSYKIQKK